MEQEDQLFALADAVARRVKDGESFMNAFGYAFRRSDFDPDLYLQVRIGVGSILRARREKHPPSKPKGFLPKQLTLISSKTPTSAVR